MKNNNQRLLRWCLCFQKYNLNIQHIRLLGLQWDSILLVNKALPFGLPAAPKIFTALVDAAEWLIRQRIIYFCIHYLDDYLIIAVDKKQCSGDLQMVLATFSELVFPVVMNKLKGPPRCLTFLGFELDSEALEMCLP